MRPRSSGDSTTSVPIAASLRRAKSRADAAAAASSRALRTPICSSAAVSLSTSARSAAKSRNQSRRGACGVPRAASAASAARRASAWLVFSFAVNWPSMRSNSARRTVGLRDAALGRVELVAKRVDLQHRVRPRGVEAAPVLVGALGLALPPQGGVATIERVELLLVQAGQLAGQRQPLRGLAHRRAGRSFLRRADRRFDRDELRLRVRLRLDDRFARLGAVRGVGRRRGGGGRSCTRQREARDLAGRGSGEERAARG